MTQFKVETNRTAFTHVRILLDPLSGRSRMWWTGLCAVLLVTLTIYGTKVDVPLFAANKITCGFDSRYMDGAWQVASFDDHGLLVQSLRNQSSPRKSSPQRRCGLSKETSVLTYTWQARSCRIPLLRESLNDFKTKVDALPILWAGDSLLKQLYESFTDLIEVDQRASRYTRSYILVDPYSLKVVNSSEYNDCIKNPATCPRGTNEYQKHHNPNITTPYHRHISDIRWGSLVEENYYKTVILNVGHHFWKEKSSLSDGFPPETDPFLKYSTMVKNVAIFFKDTGFKGDVIYVTSPPGFSGCNSDKFDTSPNSSPPGIKDKFSWKRPAENEHYWLDLFEKHAPDVSFYMLNITMMSITRGDAHPGSDCLHLCQVGVPDEWSRLLLGFLSKTRVASTPFQQSTS